MQLLSFSFADLPAEIGECSDEGAVFSEYMDFTVLQVSHSNVPESRLREVDRVSEQAFTEPPQQISSVRVEDFDCGERAGRAKGGGRERERQRGREGKTEGG